MKNLKKNLKSVNKDLKALAKKVDRMIITVGKLEKQKTVKVKPVKKVAVKKPAAKKPVKLTAADTVLEVIKRYRKGVDVSTLMEKTGFNRRKIYDNVKVLKKQGKIKSEGRGVYVKA
jgi:predicted Rossmann fold nucleotide-binding protein DprA/Smf involved in DNA uptake